MPTRTHTAKRPATGRFNRSAGTSTRRPAGRRPAAAASRRTMIVPRRKPQKSGMAKVVAGLTGALPGGGAKKAAGGSKGRTAGLAVLAGAAGLALKNRDKLQGMIRGKGSGTGDRAAHADAPANPVVVTEPGPGASGTSAPGTATPGIAPLDAEDRPAG
jgi:hypothetical protein